MKADEMRNYILLAVATLVIGGGTISTVSAHHHLVHSGNMDSQCANILADPQGAAGGGAEYCRTRWDHAPLLPYPGYGHYGYGYGDPVAECAARFRSYNPATHTYIGYDGRPHHCP
jgi:hypothetical protein